MSLDRVRGWMVTHLPRWAWPISPFGRKGRPDLPERHKVVNDLTGLSLRVDRINRLRGDARYGAWREQHRE